MKTSSEEADKMVEKYSSATFKQGLAGNASFKYWDLSSEPCADCKILALT